jgi:malate/lactate dehydrogenase
MSFHNLTDQHSNLVQNLSNFKIRELEAIQKGTPLQYRINIISSGRMAYRFTGLLLSNFKNDPIISEINIFNPFKCIKKQGEYILKSPYEDNAGINADLNEIMNNDSNKILNQRFNLKTYRTLRELGEEIISNGKKLNSSNVGEITVVMSKYNLNFLDNFKEEEVLKYKNFFRTTLLDYNENLGETFSKLKKKYTDISKIIDEIIKEKNLNPNRANNLKNSIICISELGNALKGYKGHLLNAVNEIDTTSYILAKNSMVNPAKVLGLCDNDMLRYKTFFEKKLKQSYNSDNLFLPVIGSHNEFMTHIQRMISTKSGLFYKTYEGKVNLEEIRDKVMNFGLDVYEYRKSSDEDSAQAMYNMVYSILFEINSNYDNVFNNQTQSLIRASSRFKKEEFFTGFLLSHNKGLAVPYKLDEMIEALTDEEKKIFDKGNQIQLMINERLMQEGFIPRKWNCEKQNEQGIINPNEIREKIEYKNETSLEDTYLIEKKENKLKQSSPKTYMCLDECILSKNYIKINESFKEKLKGKNIKVLIGNTDNEILSLNIISYNPNNKEKKEIMTEEELFELYDNILKHNSKDIEKRFKTLAQKQNLETNRELEMLLSFNYLVSDSRNNFVSNFENFESEIKSKGHQEYIKEKVELELYNLANRHNRLIRFTQIVEYMDVLKKSKFYDDENDTEKFGNSNINFYSQLKNSNYISDTEKTSLFLMETYMSYFQDETNFLHIKMNFIKTLKKYCFLVEDNINTLVEKHIDEKNFLVATQNLKDKKKLIHPILDLYSPLEPEYFDYMRNEINLSSGILERIIKVDEEMLDLQ